MIRSTAGTWASVDVGEWEAEHVDETRGTKRKFWAEGPDGRRWLYKQARVDRNGWVSGEDWAECLVHELAKLMGVPTARVHLASYEGQRGVVSLSVVRDGERLEHGNELLAASDAAYDKQLARANPRYTVKAVRTALHGIAAPIGWAGPTNWTAFDVWSGYLLMDARVAGRDRHHENWGAVSDGERRWLAPSYDHGNALGFQERDERRARLCGDADGLRLWARRGTCPYFADQPSLVALAHRALDLASPAARRLWLERLTQVDDPAMNQALAAVPSRGCATST